MEEINKKLDLVLSHLDVITYMLVRLSSSKENFDGNLKVINNLILDIFKTGEYTKIKE